MLKALYLNKRFLFLQKIANAKINQIFTFGDDVF
jgi:hypothetical protein